MKETVVLLIGQGLATFLSVFFAYKCGRMKEKQNHEQQKNDNLRRAALLRRSLDDADVRDRLRGKYQR